MEFFSFSIVGSGILLQGGMVAGSIPGDVIGFLICSNLSVALWPWGRLNL
jgi:hypothetical protein